MPTAKHTVMLGDILPPLKSRIIDYGLPLDLTSITVKFRLLSSTNAVILDDITTGVTVHPTQTITVDTTLDLIKCDSHGVREDITPMDQVKFAAATTIPGGLDAAVWYFPINVTPNSFQVSLTPGGAKVDITSSGSGALTMIIRGSVQMDFALTEVDADGLFKGYWRYYSGSEFSTYPKGRGEYIPIDVPALG